MTDFRSITVETSHDFIAEFRKLERRITRNDTLLKAYVRAGDADRAAEASDRHAEAVDAQEDLLYDEMRRLWTNERQTDHKLPSLPEAWEAEAAGRAIRFSFYEVEAFRGI
jgi:hypothetical protein